MEGTQERDSASRGSSDKPDRRRFLVLVIGGASLIVLLGILRLAPDLLLSNNSAPVSSFVGQSLPNHLMVQDSKDQKENLKTLIRGKRALVAFWASWCEPCVRELPLLLKLKPQFEKAGLTLLLVNFDEGTTASAVSEQIHGWMKEQNIRELHTYFNPSQKLFEQLNVNFIPIAFDINEQGVIEDILHGEQDWEAWVAKKTPTSLRSK